MTAKLCKYNCQAQLTWSTEKSKFVEADGTEHSKERCAYLKSLLPKAPSLPPAAPNAQIAPPNVPAVSHYAERDAAISKMHDERMVSDAAMTKAINGLSTVLAEYLKSSATRDDKLIQLLDAAIKSMPMWNNADKLTKELSTAG